MEPIVKLSLLPISIVLGSMSVFAAACSSTTRVDTEAVDSGATTDDAGPKATTDASGSSDASKTTPKDGSPSTPTSADKCAASPAMQSCQQCCAESEQTAYAAFQTALLKCGCQDTVCKTQCATTICAATPAQPNAECQTCLGQSQSGACKTDIEKVCSGTGTCAPFAECVSVGCAGKK